MTKNDSILPISCIFGMKEGMGFWGEGGREGGKKEGGVSVRLDV